MLCEKIYVLKINLTHIFFSIIISVGVDRSIDSIRKKIGDLEAQHHTATDWLSKTGQGVTCEKTLREVVLKMCPHFYELDPVFGSRPSATAPYTNEDDSSFDCLSAQSADDESLNSESSRTNTTTTTTRTHDERQTRNHSETLLSSNASSYSVHQLPSVTNANAPSPSSPSVTPVESSTNETVRRSVIEARRLSPKRMKRSSRDNAMSPKSIKAPRSSIQVMPSELGIYYSERSNIIKQKNERDVEKHDIEMKRQKMDLMMQLIEKKIVDNFEDAKAMIDSGIFN